MFNRKYDRQYNFALLPHVEEPGYATFCECGQRAKYDRHQNDGTEDWPLIDCLCFGCMHKWVVSYPENEHGWKPIIMYANRPPKESIGAHYPPPEN